MTLSESKEELTAVAASHGWSLENIVVSELVPSEESLRTDEQYTMFHPSETELGETTNAILATFWRTPSSLLLTEDGQGLHRHASVVEKGPAPVREIRELTGRRWLLLDAQAVVTRLNRLLVGWANYFCLGPVSKAYQRVDHHVGYRLRQWLCAKH